jgi:hypothetical protein
MPWLQRYKINSLLWSSVWFPPLIGMVAALRMHPLIRWVDAMLGWKAVVPRRGRRRACRTVVVDAHVHRLRPFPPAGSREEAAHASDLEAGGVMREWRRNPVFAA